VAKFAEERKLKLLRERPLLKIFRNLSLYHNHTIHTTPGFIPGHE
jgi:hypothetical protein